jgi:aspartyl protease family protein
VVLSNQIVGISPQMKGLGLLGQTFFGSYDVTIKKDVIELRHRP